MARFRDEEEDAPVERKRRRPKKKPVSDDEDDAPPSRGKRGRQDDDEEEENSLSTGNVFLDIFLDFCDDCVDWGKAHFRAALAIVILFTLLLLTGFGLTVRYIINYINRPTLELALQAYDLGSYPEARHFAEQVLKYAKKDDDLTQCGAYFVLGASTCAIAEIAWDSNRQPYYLAATSYLQKSAEYGFIRGREQEGEFLLGKSLYLSGELERCREPLQNVLDAVSVEKPAEPAVMKSVFWFLTNSYFLAPEPDYTEAIRYLRLFRRNPLVTEEERAEADLLDAMIRIRWGDGAGAEEALRRVPIFDRLQTMRSFVEGQIALLKARSNRRQAEQLQRRRDPLSLGEIPVATRPLDPMLEPVAKPKPAESNSAAADTPPPLPDPFDNPETESLLPDEVGVPIQAVSDGDSGEDDTSIWPVFPISPKDFDSRPQSNPWAAVTPPTPIDADDHSLSHRLAVMRSVFAGPVAQDATPQPSETKEATTEGTAEPKPFDPDAVIVLPTEEKQETSPKNAPVPADVPKDAFTKPAPINPVEKATQEFHQQAQNYYQAAIACFAEVRQRDLFSPHWKRQSHLLEGLCYEEMGDLVKAQNVYLAVVDTYPQSAEAAAANFLRADIEYKLGRGDTALRGFAQAFEIMRDRLTYACPWLTKAAMLDRCHEIIRNAITVQEYRQALTLLHLLRDVMPESDIARLQGEIYEDWAGDLRRQANSAFGARGDELQKESSEKYCRSATAFERWAQLEFAANNVDEYLWRSAENYRFGKDYRHAIPAYRRFLRTNLDSHRPEVYLYLGEMYINLDGIDEATEVLEGALRDYPDHPMAPRLRFMLSRAYYEQKEWDKAGEMLQLNLIGEFAPSSSIFRDSLYALAHLQYEQGKWEDAITGFESALKLHPNAVQTADAHYCLAQSYLRRAENMVKDAAASPLEAVRRKVEADALQEQEKALAQLQKAEELLIKRQQALGLTEAEQLMLRNTLFGAGSILMRLKMYEQAIATLNLAATRYQDRPESMDALLNLAVAFRHLNNRAETLATLNRAEVVLRQLVKNGTIPAENRWAALIDVQKNLVNAEEINP